VLLDELEGYIPYLPDIIIAKKYQETIKRLEAAISNSESDSDCEHEFESCPAVKCEKCGLILED